MSATDPADRRELAAIASNVRWGKPAVSDAIRIRRQRRRAYKQISEAIRVLDATEHADASADVA
jgi:hypothetical protein